jgi:hypothetical protein
LEENAETLGAEKISLAKLWIEEEQVVLDRTVEEKKKKQKELEARREALKHQSL